MTFHAIICRGIFRSILKQDSATVRRSETTKGERLPFLSGGRSWPYLTRPGVALTRATRATKLTNLLFWKIGVILRTIRDKCFPRRRPNVCCRKHGEQAWASFDHRTSAWADVRRPFYNGRIGCDDPQEPLGPKSLLQNQDHCAKKILRKAKFRSHWSKANGPSHRWRPTFLIFVEFLMLKMKFLRVKMGLKT